MSNESVQTSAFRRFFKKFPHGQDLSLIVLKGHLLLEEQIKLLINAKLANPSALDDASRFDCFQMICLAQSLHKKGDKVIYWNAAKKLNTIRNDIAHKIDQPGLVDKIQNFIDVFPSGFSYEEDELQDKLEKSILLLVVNISSSG